MGDFVLKQELTIPDNIFKNLTTLENRINAISNASEKMGSKFVSAVNKMNGSDLQNLISKVNTLRTAMSGIGASSNTDKNLSNTAKNAEQAANGIVNMANALNKVNTENKNIAELTELVKKLNKELTKNGGMPIAGGVQQSVVDTRNAYKSMLRTQQQSSVSYEGAMSLADSATNIAQRTEAIKQLKKAREQLSTTDANYKNKLDALNGSISKMNKLNNETIGKTDELRRRQSNLLNTSDQLMRKLALVFSVSQISGYIRNLVQVRGEFELQNRALAAILQNKDQADKLFGQIQQLAIKSPFTVKELTTYSKQLAAYQFQYEELYDTTKRLADVSAGLGVDMGRLALAIGQVKAANYLRGTETRQFTEAGLNILGELSKYYTELEGRIVSVSEVQERQFKRMIAYEDVAEVFRRITDEGGMFYNMQEQLAESLAGQMSNLRDSLDIMMNDIGKANDGILKGLISFARSVIDNWETIMQIAKPIVSVLALYVTLTKGWALASKNMGKIFNNISVALSQVGISLKKAGTAQAAFNKSVAANGWLTIGAIVVAAIWEVVSALQAANKQQEELNNIASEGFYNSQKSVRQYEQLANVVADTTATYQEQEKALKTLKRVYGDILPEQYLQAKTIREMKGNYEEATAAIYNYIRAKTQEKQLQYITTESEEGIQDAQKVLADKVQKEIKANYGYELSLEEINAQLAIFRKQFEEGFIKSPEQAKKKINELFSKYLNKDISLNLKDESERYNFVTGESFSVYTDIATNFYNTLNQLAVKTNQIINQSTITFGDRITQQLQQKREEVDAEIKRANSLLDILSKEGQRGVSGELITQDTIDRAKKELIDLTKFWGIKSEEIKGLTNDAFSIKEFSSKIQKSALSALSKEIGSMKLPKNELASARKFFQDLNLEIESLDESRLQSYVRSVVVSAAELNDISLSNVIDAFAEAGETLPDLIKRIEGNISTLKDAIANFMLSPYLEVKDFDIEKAQKQLAVNEAVLNAIKPKETKTTGGRGTDKELERFKKRVDLLKKANSEYEKLLEVYGKEEAHARVMDKFKEALIGTGLSKGFVTSMEFDLSGVVDSIKKLSEKAKTSIKQAAKEEIAPMETEIGIDIRKEDIEAVKNEFDNLFGTFEMSVELEDLGLPKEMASKLFGFEYVSLDDLKKNLAEAKAKLEEYGNEGAETYAEMQKKMTDAEDKEVQERMKNYSEYLKKSISERANAEIEAQREIAKIQASSDLSTEGKSLLIENVKKKAAKEMAKFDWQAFKGSDTYTQMFEDIEYVSERALQRIKQNLEGIRDSIGENLSPEDMKSFTEAYSKIETELIKRNPFKSMLESIKKIRELEKQGKTEESLQEQMTSLEMQRNSLNQQISDLEIIIGLKDRGISLDNLSGEFLERNANLLKKDSNELRNILSLKKFSMNRNMEQMGVTQEELDSFIEARIALDGMKNRFDSIRNISRTAFESIKSILESIGVESDNTGMILADMSMNMIDLVAQGVAFYIQLQLMTAAAESFGVTLNAALGPIGWAVLALQGLATVFTAIVNIHDNKQNKIIEDQKDRVEQLQKAYEKLEQAIDDALNPASAKYSYEAAQRNIDQQIESYEKMLAAEKEKKKQDEDAMKEYQDAIDDLKEKRKELYAETLQSYGGFGDMETVKSAAREFADAWLEAYRETGDGLDALNDKWDEYIDNLIANKLMMAGFDKFLKPIMDFVDSSLEDFEFSPEEAAKMQEMIDKTVPELNEFWKTLMGQFGNIGAGSPELSGLSKGIQSITEETAQALEALLNSIRGMVSDANRRLASINALLLNPPTESPYLSEMRLQTEQLRTLNSLMSSMSKMDGSNGRVMKVKMM